MIDTDIACIEDCLNDLYPNDSVSLVDLLGFLNLVSSISGVPIRFHKLGQIETRLGSRVTIEFLSALIEYCFNQPENSVYSISPFGTVGAVPVILDREYLGTVVVYPQAEDISVPVNIRSIAKHNRTLDVIRLIKFVISGKRLVNDQLVELPENENQIGIVRVDYYNHLNEQREEKKCHATQDYENEVIQSIRTGDASRLATTLKFGYCGGIGLMVDNKEDEVRQAKNMIIAASVLASRAAVDGGMGYEEAMTLSDTYVQKAERLNELNSILPLSSQMLMDFTRNVALIKPNRNLSRPIKKAIQYLTKNLNRVVTIQEVAQYIGYSRTHLSRLFRTELGCGFLEYVHKIKIDEAIDLLRYSEMSIGDITAALAFSTKSHFIKIFKDHIGQTPSEYRNHS